MGVYNSRRIARGAAYGAVLSSLFLTVMIGLLVFAVQHSKWLYASLWLALAAIHLYVIIYNVTSWRSKRS